MKHYDKEGLCCYYVSSGGGIADILKSIQKAIVRLEAESEGILAEGKFPMFEHGLIGVFHNDHTLNEGMRNQLTYMSQRTVGGPKGQRGPVNEQYWKDLQEVVNQFAALVKRPAALVGGDPTKYYIKDNPDAVEKYRLLTREVCAVFQSRGIVTNDCVEFLRGISVPDLAHVAEEDAEMYVSFCVTECLNAPFASLVQQQLLKRHADLLVNNGWESNFSDREALLNDVRVKLLNGGLSLAAVIKEADNSKDFEVAMPTVLQDLADSEGEDMTKRYKHVVDRRRSRRRLCADPQGSAPPQGTIPVDI
jgi:hypothetical protein